MDEKPSTDDRPARTTAARDEVVRLLVDELRTGVAWYHDRNVEVDFDALDVDEQRQWLQAAEGAIESAVDHIIEAGRPIWWTTP